MSFYFKSVHAFASSLAVHAFISSLCFDLKIDHHFVICFIHLGSNEATCIVCGFELFFLVFFFQSLFDWDLPTSSSTLFHSSMAGQVSYECSRTVKTFPWNLIVCPLFSWNCNWENPLQQERHSFKKIAGQISSLSSVPINLSCRLY